MMKSKVLYIILLITLGISQTAMGEILLSKNIFRKVPFSSQYSEDGSLIRSTDFRSVNSLIPQLQKKFKQLLKGKNLRDRNESHITVITPPEGKSNFFPGSIGIDKVLPTNEMINMYKGSLQDTTFDVVCVGMQSNSRGNIVFYLVVESEDILNIRKEISLIVSSQDPTIPFKPVRNYYPHITIGFVGGDVHGVSKGEDSCVAEVSIKLSNITTIE